MITDRVCRLVWVESNPKYLSHLEVYGIKPDSEPFDAGRYIQSIVEQIMNNKQRLAVLILILTGLASAQADTSAQKFGRGLAGMTCGFLELPGNIVKETDAHGAAGLPTGLAMGIGMMVTRELVGVYEFLSAPFPVPAGFKPVLQPEYPWSYFK